MPYLARLVEDTPSAANIRAYARIVRDHAMLRQLIEIGGDIAASAHATEGRTAAEIVDRAEQRVFEIAEGGQRRGSGFVSLKQVLPKTIDRLDFLSHSTSEITGVSTGFGEMDKMTAGLQRGELIIIAGRPSMGKTTLAINIAENAALGHKVPAAIFSMEMSAEQLSFRMLSSIGRIAQTRLRTGKLQDEDWPRVDSAVSMMSDAPIFIDDSGALTPTEVRARARRLKREHGLGLIVVDYLQLMQVTGTVENRATEISEISRSLKALAKELDVPVIALSQLNRSVEQRQDKRPVMSDLREIGRDRAGRRSDPVHLSRRGLRARHAAQGHRRHHHREAAQRPRRRLPPDVPRRVHEVREPRRGGLRRGRVLAARLPSSGRSPSSRRRAG